MEAYTFIVLFAFVTVAKTNAPANNLVLATFDSSGYSEFSTGGSTHRYSNGNKEETSHNGRGQVSTKVQTTLEQTPGGGCIRKIVTTTNGIRDVKVIPINCDEALKEIRQKEDEVRKETERNFHKIREEQEKMKREQLEFSNKIMQQFADIKKKFNL